MERQSLSQLLTGTPEASLLSEEVWARIPSELRGSYQKQARLVEQSWVEEKVTDVEAWRAIHALGWEVECLLRLKDAGVSFSPKASSIKHGWTAHPRYEKNQDVSQAPALAGERVRMQNDVPVWDEASRLPHWVETKCMFFRPYGQSYRPGEQSGNFLNVKALNQLLKYQLALDQGWISAATVLLRGRVLPHMWDWMTQGLDGKGSRIPGVEVLWSLPLPSGGSMWMKIKPGTGPELARPTPLLSAQDEAAVAGFHVYAGDHDRLRHLLAGDVPVPSGIGVCDPWDIPNVAQSREYLNSWRTHILASVSTPSPKAPRPGR